MTEPEACRSTGCTMQARVAIRTLRGSGARRGEMTNTIYMDNRTAPKLAARYCTKHGAEMAAGLVSLADEDEPMPNA